MDTWRLRLKSQDHADTGSVPGQSQLVLPSELMQLTKENRVTLEEVKELTARTFAAFGAMSQVESLRELDGLVKMAKHLEKVVVSISNNCTASKHANILTVKPWTARFFKRGESFKHTRLICDR